VLEIPMIVVPDSDDRDCANILVDGNVAGRPYRFYLDTGAARTQLASDEYTAGLATRGQDASAQAFSAATSDVVTISDLTLGALSVASLDVVRAGPAPASPNLLGMDVLGRYCCCFRFDAQILELAQSPALQDGLPLTVTRRGQFHVQLDWADASASGCWDSGAGITLISQEFHRAHRDLFTEAGSSVGMDGSGTTVETPVYLMEGPLIGGVPFAPARVAVLDMTEMNRGLETPMDLVVGYTLGSQANWAFDVPARCWARPVPVPG
jgi:hypothetical protein